MQSQVAVYVANSAAAIPLSGSLCITSDSAIIYAVSSRDTALNPLFSEFSGTNYETYWGVLWTLSGSYTSVYSSCYTDALNNMIALV